MGVFQIIFLFLACILAGWIIAKSIEHANLLVDLKRYRNNIYVGDEVFFYNDEYVLLQGIVVLKTPSEI